MTYKALISLVIIHGFMCCVVFAIESNKTDVGLWSDIKLSQIITSASLLDSPGEQIVELSSHFINTPYVADTLIGGPLEDELLVVNLNELDCFTFLDVVEALRLSSAVAEFPVQLKSVRYRNGTLDYTARRHFFSDWVVGDTATVIDITHEVGKGTTQAVVKDLNRKNGPDLWLPGIKTTPRTIFYIPTDKIDAELTAKLQSGDYVGIYSEYAGLDVSHTGVIVKSKGITMLRHASSRSGVERVVDENLLEYLQGKPGLIVYRVKP